MKIAFKFLAVSVIVLVVISILPSCGSTYLSRWIFWNFSDIEDYQKFPYRDVSNASPIFNFAPVSVPQVNTISYQYKGKNHQKTVVDFVNQTETTALIVIKNDSLLYEG
ncbi:MAG: hypothetical protein RIF39_08170, partial [Cyclobacteriaceae bacterium]